MSREAKLFQIGQAKSGELREVMQESIQDHLQKKECRALWQDLK
jgi:hypothetical protein